MVATRALTTSTSQLHSRWHNTTANRCVGRVLGGWNGQSSSAAAATTTTIPMVPRSDTAATTTTTAVRCFGDKKNPVLKKKQTKVKKDNPFRAATMSDDAAKDMKILNAALEAPMWEEPPISEEEKARRFEIGRQYNIGCFRAHNKLMHDLACKRRMKEHAVNMLPRNYLKKEALKIDDSGPPMWRNIPMWTAPIPGFDPSKYIDKDDEDD